MIGWLTRRLQQGERDAGAYAVMYAVLIVVAVAFASILVDTSAMRQDRRDNRSATDSAATAGAFDLQSGSQNPQQACLDAVSYLKLNLPNAGAASVPCSTFPTTVSSCPTTDTTVTGTIAPGYNVAITWPVQNNSALLTNPDIRGSGGSVATNSLTQSYNPTVDGTDPCARLGVAVTQFQPFSFAQAMGTGNGSTTTSYSVARGAQAPGPNVMIAALNVLDPNHCDTVTTSGQGSIEVKGALDPTTGNPAGPGIIAVQSAGVNGGCPSNNPFVIDPGSNGNNFIYADGADGTRGAGIITSYAVTVGNPKAYTGAGVQLKPTPTSLPLQYGSKPVTDRFGCGDISPCGTTGIAAGSDYMANLICNFGYGVAPNSPATSPPCTLPNKPKTPPLPYAAVEAPYNAAAFQTLTGTALPAFACTQSAPLLIPPGNWYINCPNGFTVNANVIFAGGNIVFAGPVSVGQSSATCLAINVPEGGSPTCPTVTSGVISPTPTLDSIVYIRNGDFSKGGQASVYLPHTFVFENGTGCPTAAGSTTCTSMGAGSGALYWTGPRPDQIAAGACASSDTVCKYSRFFGLDLWNANTSIAQLFGGQAGMTLQGVFFMPNSQFTFLGQSTINQLSAQFWCYDIAVKGQGGLVMQPDEVTSIPFPFNTAQLIR